MKTEKIFILDSEKAFKMAEKYKGNLENKGFRVETKPYGVSGVRITGIEKCNKAFLKEQIKETKRVLAKSKYPPYRNELKRSLKFWEKELESCKR